MVTSGSHHLPQSLQDYYHQLEKANLNESSDPHFCLQLLEKCLSLLQSNSNFENSYPQHIPILKARVDYLKTFPSDWNRSKKAHLNKNIQKKGVSASDTIDTVSQNSEFENENEDIEDLSNSDVIEPNSLNSDLMGITAVQVEKKTLSSIFQEVFSSLIDDLEVSYEQYLKFFQELNLYYSDPFPTIIRDNRNMIYYIGDTHGSFKETRILIQYFQKIIDTHSSVRFVFLGDYVDRNPQDLENLCLIIAFAVLNPDNVTLLRGNHEDSTINKAYGFSRNLEDAFVIENQITALYSEILAFFMKLSIIHIDLMFDSQNNRNIRIMAVHGGIPVNVSKPDSPINLEQMDKIIKPQIDTYTNFDVYMNWLLWADPKEDMTGIIYDKITGRSQFGPDAFNNFMTENQLDFMVRAHEKWAEGIHWFFNHRLVSLFSTSYYNGVKIGDGKILRLQPGMGPAILPINEEQLNQDAEALK